MKKILLLLLCGIALNCNAQSSTQPSSTQPFDSATFEEFDADSIFFELPHYDTIPALFIISVKTQKNLYAEVDVDNSLNYDYAFYCLLYQGYVYADVRISFDVKYYYEVKFLTNNKKPFSPNVTIWDYKILDK